MKFKIGGFLLLFAFAFVGHAAGDNANKKSYVTPWLKSGQLGNQMFEIATTLAHAWDHQLKPVFPGLNQDSFNLPINRKKIFFRLDATPIPRPVRHTFHQYCNYENVPIPVKKDQLLKGYFQTWKYFHHHRDKILEMLAPHPEEVAKIRAKHSSLLNHPCTVGVHVRTFNKKWSADIPFVGLSYYEKAMSLFPADALFVVFSDRINWCKHHFSKFNRPIIFIDDQDHIEDLILMSSLRHNIIANSSFSWWAAYMNKNPGKIVVAPSHFVRPHVVASCRRYSKAVTNPNLPDWITLDIDYDYILTPYPDDICDYDADSKSLDTK